MWLPFSNDKKDSKDIIANSNSTNISDPVPKSGISVKWRQKGDPNISTTTTTSQLSIRAPPVVPIKLPSDHFESPTASRNLETVKKEYISDVDYERQQNLEKNRNLKTKKVIPLIRENKWRLGSSGHETTEIIASEDHFFKAHMSTSFAERNNKDTSDSRQFGVVDSIISERLENRLIIAGEGIDKTDGLHPKAYEPKKFGLQVIKSSKKNELDNEDKCYDQNGLDRPLLSKNRPPLAKDGLSTESDDYFKWDVHIRPEENSVEEYEEMPVEEFGTALLRGMGWEEGRAIGKDSSSSKTQPVEPLILTPRRPGLGLGADAMMTLPKMTRKKK